MKIWIDLSDLEVWSGHLTGTQRVTYNIAYRYATSKHQVGYFIFNERKGVFVEADFEPIRQKVEAAQVSVASAAVPSSQPLGLKGRIKKLPRRALDYMPDSVKQRIPSSSKRILKGLYHRSTRAARQLSSKVKDSRKVMEADLPIVDFAANDAVLVLGKPWDFPALMPALGILKQQRKFKLFCVVYDLIPIFEPHLFGPGLFEPYTRNLFETAQLSDGLMAISASTKKDMARFCKELNIAMPPTTVIRLGDDILSVDIGQGPVTVPDTRLKSGNYLLCVGTIEVRKNIALLYMAYREAALRKIELPYMVIVGRPGWLTGDILYAIAHDPEVKEKFSVLQGLNDQQLQWLYQNCRFGVFPSVYEGWGLPVAESLGYGKVCLSSFTSSMREIAGDLLEYYSPYNTQELLDLLVKYMDDSTLQRKEKQIAEQYKPVSWDHTYNQVDKFVSN